MIREGSGGTGGTGGKLESDGESESVRGERLERHSTPHKICKTMQSDVAAPELTEGSLLR